MRRLALAAGAIVLACSGLGAQTAIPADGFAPGWAKSEPLRIFRGTALFDHIDGGAELYLEFGFRELAVQRYEKGEDEIVLEIYEFDGPEAALGLYLMKCGKETPIPGIGARNSSEPAQFTILKGRVFVHVNNSSGREDLVPAMTALANLALDAYPGEAPRDLFSILPRNGLVPGSAVLFRGPVGLSSLFTLGDGDILSQGGLLFGAAGTYDGGADGRHTMILIEYPDEGAARNAFQFLADRLDPYLKILEKGESCFVFEDYQNKFGRAARTGRTLAISVRLTGKPSQPR